MKRFISISAVLILTVVISLCLGACEIIYVENGNKPTQTTAADNGNNAGDNSLGAEHIHAFSNWSTTVAPTCSAQGKQTRTCSSCGFSEYSDLPKLSHKYDNGMVTTNATCNQKGLKRFTCTNTGCNHYYTEEYSLPTHTATEIYEESVKYVGEIVTYDKSGSEYALGTGFVMSSDGKIITNYHVIDGAYSAKITIDNKTYVISSVLAYDEQIDLAVLKINATGMVAANICKKPVHAGETVYAIGSSRGLTNTYSQGIITYADRIVDGVSHVQHDASITHGNSGGPLINVYGEVIGINTWGVSDSQNLNFAVFTDELDNLVYSGAISLAEFYALTNDPQELLLDWLLDNYDYSSSESIRFDYENDNAWYSLAYDLEEDYVYIDVLWEFNDGAELYLLIDFSYDPSSQYSYYAVYSHNSNSNSTLGYINAPTFTVNTPLSYTSYDGTHWDRAELLDFYQTAVVDLLSWFDWAAEEYDMGVTIRDLGFDVF